MLRARICEHRGVIHRVYLVGGPARVGKSALAQRLLLSDGIPWLPTDVLRTVLRRVLPELDDLDRGNVSAMAVGELMYPHIEQAVEVCGEEAEQFLEGPEIVPWVVPRLSAALPGITIRSCFLGGVGFSADDLAGNTDLTVYLTREPVGEWIGLDAMVFTESIGAGLSDAAVYDDHGRLGRANQGLFVDER